MTLLITTICTAGLLLMALSGFLIEVTDGPTAAAEPVEPEPTEPEPVEPEPEPAVEPEPVPVRVFAPWPWTLPHEPGLSQRFDRYEALGVNHVRSVEEILDELDRNLAARATAAIEVKAA